MTSKTTTSQRCRHQLVPLCPRPETTEGRAKYLFCPLTGYVVCERCGRVGWYTKFRGRLSWHSTEDSERLRQEAVKWR
jgi:hypothetical protein